MSWDHVIGQSRVKGILRSAMERKRLAHAYLFSGAAGSGTEALSIELAKALNCGQSATEACDRCPDCLKMSLLQHPNLHLIFPLPVGKNEKNGDSPLAKLSDDEIAAVREQIQIKAANAYHTIQVPKANTIKINSVREIRREVSLSAFARGVKVFIVFDAEDLNDEASNALLKTLEEPPPGTLILLTTSRPEKLVPTIVSRCQQIRFDPLSVDEIRNALEQRQGVSPEQSGVIARLSGGSYSRALQLIHTDMGERRAEAISFLRIALGGTRKEILEEIEGLVTNHQRPELEEFLLILQAWIRDAMVVGQHQQAAIGAEEFEALQKFALHYPELDFAQLHQAIDRAVSYLRENVYIPLILLNLTFALRATASQSHGTLGESASQR